jgi:gamma-glutamyl-gamma-aminobutyrate hydrolase PuuD
MEPDDIPTRIPDRRGPRRPRSVNPLAVLRARAGALRERAARVFAPRTLRIGVSARIYHPRPDGVGVFSRRLQYLEESLAHWVMTRDALVVMVPTVNRDGLLHPSNVTLCDYAQQLDGLVLQGGADVAPQTYGETPLRPEWEGDRARDVYELELLHAFVDAGKPVLGICRGCQLLNVAFGGTLHQDVETTVPNAHRHVSPDYDAHRHAVHFAPGSSMARMFAGTKGAVVNSIHHQAVKQLGRDVAVEALSDGDGIVEAIRYLGAPFVMGLQWHPEFHSKGGTELLDCTPILDEFLRAARR